MAIHPDFPTSPYEILDPSQRWFPADETLRASSYDKLLPPLVHKIRHEVKEWRESCYAGATETSKALLQWWFSNEHIITNTDGTMVQFKYYFAQQNTNQEHSANLFRISGNIRKIESFNPHNSHEVFSKLPKHNSADSLG
jgi:hypothetical protein